MKRLNISLLAILLITTVTFAQYDNPGQTVYQKLSDVNKEWLTKNFDDDILQQHTVFQSDEALIQLHLQLVEAKLRAADVQGLTKEQQAKRQQGLDYLHEYWQTGKFPQNTHHAQRTPYFIDDFGTACAVGHIMIESGYEGLAQKINAASNYAYVREMPYPQLLAWAGEYGFSVDELAWIQPAYSTNPTYSWSAVGGDVTGSVQTMAIDGDNVLYVAADFGTTANNIRAFDGYNWMNLGDGVNGAIHVIFPHDGKVYVGGSFTMAGNIPAGNIAVWDGSQWSAIGNGVPGEVNALAVYNDDIYAGGHFTFQQNVYGLIKWTGTNWDPLVNGPKNTVNALEVFQKELYAGGAFNMAGAQPVRNFVKFNGSIFSDIGGYPSPVRALQIFEDSLIIGGDFTFNDTTYETSGLSVYGGSSIISLSNSFDWSVPWNKENYFINSLNVADGRLYISGSFTYYPMYGFHGTNAVVADSISYWTNSALLAANGITWGADSTINAAVNYNGQMLIGGDFKSLGGSSASYLASTGDIHVGVPQISNELKFQVINQTDKALIKVEKTDQHRQIDFILTDLSGKKIKSISKVGHQIEILQNEFASGVYVFNFFEGDKIVGSGKLLL